MMSVAIGDILCVVRVIVVGPTLVPVFDLIIKNMYLT
jgi:hypothetical protein